MTRVSGSTDGHSFVKNVATMSRTMVLVGALLSGRATETGVNMAILVDSMRERMLVHQSERGWGNVVEVDGRVLERHIISLPGGESQEVPLAETEFQKHPAADMSCARRHVYLQTISVSASTDDSTTDKMGLPFWPNGKLNQWSAKEIIRVGPSLNMFARRRTIGRASARATPRSNSRVDGGS